MLAPSSRPCNSFSKSWYFPYFYLSDLMPRAIRGRLVRPGSASLSASSNTISQSPRSWKFTESRLGVKSSHCPCQNTINSQGHHGHSLLEWSAKTSTIPNQILYSPGVWLQFSEARCSPYFSFRCLLRFATPCLWPKSSRCFLIDL